MTQPSEVTRVTSTEEKARLVIDGHLGGTVTFSPASFTCGRCGMEAPSMGAHLAERLSVAGCLIPWPDRP